MKKPKKASLRTPNYLDAPGKGTSGTGLRQAGLYTQSSSDFGSPPPGAGDAGRGPPGARRRGPGSHPSRGRRQQAGGGFGAEYEDHGGDDHGGDDEPDDRY